LIIFDFCSIACYALCAFAFGVAFGAGGKGARCEKGVGATVGSLKNLTVFESLRRRRSLRHRRRLAFGEGKKAKLGLQNFGFLNIFKGVAPHPWRGTPVKKCKLN
jgi:hypothetical protein